MIEPIVDYTTLPLKCPRCGLHGWILLSRADRRFRCKRCRTKFYIDLVGDVIAGDPPVGKRTNTEFDPLGAIVATWGQFPRKVRFAAVAVALGVAALGVAVPMLLRHSEIPDGLTERSRFVGLAFVRNDPKKLKGLAAPGTHPLVVQWVQIARPKSWDEVLDAGAAVAINVEATVPNYPKGTAYVLVHVVLSTAERQEDAAAGAKSLPPPDQAPGIAPARSDVIAGSEPQEALLALFWVLNKDEAWLLDGERTRKAAGGGR